MTERREDMERHDLLTPKEVADKIRFTVRGVNKLAANGKLPGAIKVGRFWRFDRYKLAGYLRSQERKPEQWQASTNEANDIGAAPSVTALRSDGRLERLLNLKR